jgi:outer membrane receptor protein involved in Fe transport
MILAIGILATPATADAPPNQIEEIEVIARRLDSARQAIQPGLGANQFQFDRDSLVRSPKGLDLAFDKVLLRAPGVTQDSGGEVHIRNEHGNAQYRINGILLPQGSDSFSSAIDTAIARKIVLLTGALPAQYGWNTAGVVDITTASDAFEAQNEIGIRGGTHDHREVRGQTSGNADGVNYFVTTRYLENAQGIENPTSARQSIHNDTRQFRGFGYFSKILSDHLRLSAILGAYDGTFEIPNVPGVVPAYDYLGRTGFDSRTLDQRQRESSYFGIVSVQGSYGAYDFLLAPYLRTSQTRFLPDVAGDLILNGGADRTKAQNHTAGFQFDSSYRLNGDHTLRFGAMAQLAFTRAQFSSLTFPADDDGQQASNAPLAISDTAKKTGTVYGLYVQDEWGLRDDLTLNFGARFDQLNSYARASQISPRISLTYHLTDAADFHIGYARNFTLPEQEATTRAIRLFVGTVRAPETLLNDPAKPEREHNFDAGFTYDFGHGLTMGLDGYYKIKRDLLDEGQFGESTVNSPFNYAKGNVYGVELSSGFERGGFSAYGNIAYGREVGRGINSNQITFDLDEFNYIAQHYILTDHSQTWTGSGGLAWQFDHDRGTVTFSGDFLFGSGLRKSPETGELPPNGAHLPAYTQINFGIAQRFKSAGILDGTTISVDIENAFDAVYKIRDGSGVGLGASQFGPRQAIYFSLSRRF